jgi:hypothetical protein
MKGKTNNPNGRPKGAPNKVTSTIRNWIVELINNNRDKLQEDLMQLDAKERLLMIEKLLPYIMPKAEKAVDVEGACYSKDDFEGVSLLSLETDKQRLKRWYE